MARHWKHQTDQGKHQTDQDAATAPRTREEQVDPSTQAEARQLLERTGSAELAKFAIDVASEGAAGNSAASPNELASRWGFASYLDLFEASIPHLSPSGRTRMLTPLARSRWIVWEQDALAAARVFETQDAAQRFIEVDADRIDAAKGSSTAK